MGSLRIRGAHALGVVGRGTSRARCPRDARGGAQRRSLHPLDDRRRIRHVWRYVVSQTCGRHPIAIRRSPYHAASRTRTRAADRRAPWRRRGSRHSAGRIVCVGASSLCGICTASVPPARASSSSRSSRRSWFADPLERRVRTRLQSSGFGGSPGTEVGRGFEADAAMRHLLVCRRASIASTSRRRGSTRAGQRPASVRVSSPEPQPRSTASRTSVVSIRATKVEERLRTLAPRSAAVERRDPIASRAFVTWRTVPMRSRRPRPSGAALVQRDERDRERDEPPVEDLEAGALRGGADEPRHQRLSERGPPRPGSRRPLAACGRARPQRCRRDQRGEDGPHAKPSPGARSRFAPATGRSRSAPAAASIAPSRLRTSPAARSDWPLREGEPSAHQAAPESETQGAGAPIGMPRAVGQSTHTPRTGGLLETRRRRRGRMRATPPGAAAWLRESARTGAATVAARVHRGQVRASRRSRAGARSGNPATIA